MSKSNLLSRKQLPLFSTVIRLCSYYINEMSEKALAKGSTCPPLAPGRLRLYNMRYCPYAQRTRMVLEYKKVPYEIVNVNLKYKPDWFRARNPNGLVPILEKDGVIVYESSVCNDYLDEIYPEPKLTPDDPLLKAKDKMLSESFGKVTALYYELPKSKANGTFDKTVRKFKRGMQLYETELGKRGNFFGGSSPCMVDFMIWPWFERIDVLTVIAPETKITGTTFPNLSSWIGRMMELPAVKVTVYPPEDHIHFFKTLAEGAPDYDYGLP